MKASEVGWESENKYYINILDIDTYAQSYQTNRKNINLSGAMRGEAVHFRFPSNEIVVVL